jgi:hypothetical protein
MAKINGIVLTDKGVVKTAVRKGIVEKEMKNLEINGFERVEEKATLVKEYVDLKGNVIYATLTLTVSTNDPRVEKPKKAKTSKVKEKETFDIEEE